MILSIKYIKTKIGLFIIGEHCDVSKVIQGQEAKYKKYVDIRSVEGT